MGGTKLKHWGYFILSQFQHDDDTEHAVPSPVPPMNLKEFPSISYKTIFSDTRSTGTTVHSPCLHSSIIQLNETIVMEKIISTTNYKN